MKRIDEAIAKITEEMTTLNNPLAQAVEEHLTEICTTDAVAELLLAEDKSLKGATDALWAEAKNRKQGNVAYIHPDEAFDIVENYYGITPDLKVKRISFRPSVRNILDEI